MFSKSVYNQPDKVFEISWICDKSLEYQVSDSTPSQLNQALFVMVINTKYACTSNINVPPTSSKRQKAGLALLILSLVGVVCYCVIGWWINGYRKGGKYGMDEFNDNVPHKDFWMIFPSLVWAGCAVTRDFMIRMFDKVINKRHFRRVPIDYEAMLDDENANV